MRKCKELQSEIKTKYPDFKSLPLLIRIKLRFLESPITHTAFCEEKGYVKIAQSYKTYRYNGQDYFYKFD